MQPRACPPCSMVVTYLFNSVPQATFDGCISVSALQWLCYSDVNTQSGKVKLRVWWGEGGWGGRKGCSMPVASSSSGDTISAVILTRLYGTGAAHAVLFEPLFVPQAWSQGHPPVLPREHRAGKALSHDECGLGMDCPSTTSRVHTHTLESGGTDRVVRLGCRLHGRARCGLP